MLKRSFSFLVLICAVTTLSPLDFSTSSAPGLTLQASNKLDRTPSPGPGPKPRARSGPKSINTSECWGIPSFLLLLPLPPHLQWKWDPLVFTWREAQGSPACSLGQFPVPSLCLLLCSTMLCRAWVLGLQLLLLHPSSRKFLELLFIPNWDKHLYLSPPFHTVKCIPSITNKCKYLLAMCAAIIIVVG